MINNTHLKVLLRKDFITLWRSKGFCIAFVLIPIILMNAFIAIRNLIVNGTLQGPLIFDNFKYSTTKYTQSQQQGPVPSNFYEYPPLNVTQAQMKMQPQVFVSSLQTCSQSKASGQDKYFLSKIAIIATDTAVQTAAKSYFEQYVIPTRLIVGGYQKPNPNAAPQGQPQSNIGQNFAVDVFTSIDEPFNIIQTVDQQPYCFIVNFQSFNTATDQYDVQFSFPLDSLPNTNIDAYNSLLRTPDLNSYQSWFKSGSAELFPLITEFVARYKIGGSAITQSTPLFIQQLGFSPMQSQPFINVSVQGITQLAQNFPFFFMIIFIIPFFFLTSKLASEKETKAKEGMKMMGLQNSTYYMAWFIYYMVISFVTSILVTIFAQRVFGNVNGLLFFIFCILYSINLWAIAFIIVAFLPTKRSSGIASVLFHFITYYLQTLITDPGTASSIQYGLSILPNVGMGQILKQVFFYNFQTDKGLQFSTGGTSYQGFSFAGGLILMAFMAAFWSFLGLYLDQVVPTDFGVAKPWYFLCQCKSKKINKSQDFLEDEESIASRDPRNFEKIPDSLKRQEKDNECLKIRGLVKTFGEKTAVNGTSMTMYNGQIFALLGHNGAGKTTTISMLNGMIEPTEGRAEVFGIDIFENMQNIRMMLGVCPQHDVLFEMLTPEEHLKLFAAFKGTDSSVIDQQVDQMLKDIDLTDVQTQLASTLSGGQKRKLSVAIAMIGNSKIVMLDEPTSGMDTTARRKLWEMLKKNKAGKIVILTTHYMDEADILGDRIAIMAEGDVQCTGSSLFLKNRYGVGYNLTIAKTSREPAPQVEQFIMQRITTAKKMQEVSSEISYQLPNESSLLFKNFFAEFDKNLSSLGVRSYSVGITTLEEVFLKIGHGEELEKLKNDERSAKKKREIHSAQKILNDSNDDSQEQELENYSVVEDGEKNVFFSHLWQLTRKKILMQIRDLKTLGIDTIFPLILIIIGLKISTIAVILPQKARSLTTTLYPQLKVYSNQISSIIPQSSAQSISDFTQNQIVNQYPNSMTYNSQQNLQIDTTQNTTLQVLQLDNFIFGQSLQTGNSTTGSLFVQSLNDPAQGYSGVYLVNSTQQDAVGVYASVAHNAFLKHYCSVPSSGLTCAPNLQIKFTNYPFPLDKRRLAVINAAAGTRSAILMTIAWLMVSDSLIQNIIRERDRNIKHQIMVSGSSLAAYWLGHYFADMVFQACLSIVSIICYNGFGIDLPQGWALFLVMIASNSPFIYFISFLCKDEETGSLVVKLLYFLIGLIAPIAISVLQFVNSTTIVYGNAIRWIFYPFPIYSLTFGYISICNRPFAQLINQLPALPDSYDNLVAGPALWFLLAMIVFYWLLIILIELKFFDVLFCRKRSPVKQNFDQIDNSNADEDINEEAVRVQNMQVSQLPVRLSHVQKKYDNVVAVKDISFGLEYGECFALLGVSGAGKSTLFKCLTGEIYPSQGSLSINGFNVTTSSGFDQARKQIGYCPQFDCIFEGLTVLEHLQIYATLKGVRFDLKERIIQKQIEDMDLQDYVNIRANQLSGGNRRKLSVAMALIGNPPLIFLDEPSTGVDPQAKRFMWDIVSKISTQRKKSAVIITTHSMEEAEALCTKMGIMVEGEFKCFGSATHVKDKYGTGYELEIKVRTLNEDEVKVKLNFAQQQGMLPFNLQSCQMYLQSQGSNDLCAQLTEDGEGRDFIEAISQKKQIVAEEFIKWQFTESQGNKAIDYIENLFKQFEILEHYGNSWKIKVSRDNYSIGYLFGMMEDIQKQFDISEYSVAQTTLEQIFNNFAIQAEKNAGKKTIQRKHQKKAQEMPTPNIKGEYSNQNPDYDYQDKQDQKNQKKRNNI